LQETQFWQLCRAASSDQAELWPRIEGPLRTAFEQAPADSPLARPLYVAVEKILTGNEPLPGDWPVHGTVGYEFLNRLSGLFVDGASEAHLSTTYQRFTSESLDFREIAYRCKRLIVRMSMASELQVLGYRLDRISERNRWTRDFTLNSLTRALQEVAACFTVYRTYVTQDQVPDSERHFIEAAVARAKRHNRAMSASIFDSSAMLAAAVSRQRRSGGAAGPVAVRRQVPAAHRPDYGERRGGHGLLPLQPPRLAQ
jgi:(1->4)-alpha-D-glucan 1-alpha-D-glucosylmutase